MILPNDLRNEPSTMLFSRLWSELEILAKLGNLYACLLYNACKVIHGIQLEFDK
jgi:hypothetical protein